MAPAPGVTAADEEFLETLAEKDLNQLREKIGELQLRRGKRRDARTAIEERVKAFTSEYAARHVELEALSEKLEAEQAKQESGDLEDDGNEECDVVGEMIRGVLETELREIVGADVKLGATELLGKPVEATELLVKKPTSFGVDSVERISET